MYYFLSISFCYAFPGIYLRSNPVTNGKELSPTTEKICAKYFNDQQEKVQKKV
jgi:hypothetical protein